MDNRAVTSDEAGRTCPYCHTPLEVGDAAHECELCGSLHHEDCWEEGGGCAVIGCGAVAGNSEPEVRLRGAGEPGDLGSGRKKKLLIILAAVAVVAGAIALYFVLKPDDGPTKSDPAGRSSSINGPAKKNQNASRKSRSNAAKKKATKKQKLTTEQAKRQLGLRFTRDPGSSWIAFLPSNGWSQPVDQGNQNTTDAPRYETTLEGPNRGFISVQTTPTVDPTVDPRNYTVENVPYEPKQVPSGGMASGDLIKFTNGADECAGIYCAKVLLSGGDGGGIAIIAGSRSEVLTTTIVREFAAQMDPGY